MLADTVTAYRAKALAEGSDDEIDFVLDTDGLSEATPRIPHHTHGVSLVYHQVAAIALLDFDDLFQRRNVAQHAVNALDDD